MKGHRPDRTAQPTEMWWRGWTGSSDNAVAIFSVRPPAVSTVPVPDGSRLAQSGNLAVSSVGKSCRVTFDTRAPAGIELSLFGANGKLLRRVVDGYVDAGLHTADMDFAGIQSGVYLLRLNDGLQSYSTRIRIAE
jgi:hypothetical protein